MAQDPVIPELQRDLAALGVQPGDLLLVHSSFKSLGLAGHTPAEVIATLLAVVGPAGTVLMPTFTYSYAAAWNPAPFDPATTPGLANGVLSETLRTWPGARRSAHPTYSVAAVGPAARELTAAQESISPLAEPSSLGRVCRLGGRLLLLGVGHNRNSMLHYAERVAGLPYLDIPWRACLGATALVAAGGRAVEVPLAPEFPACSANFGVVDGFLESRGLVRRGRVGAAASLLLAAEPMVAAVAAELRRNPGWLLCDQFGCEPCTRRKHRLRERGQR